jgi:hemerythrin superfamily protein
MDIFEELHSEHEKVSELIASLESTGRDEMTVKTLQSELSSHAEAEEQVFYKRLEDEDETRDLVAEGHEEHVTIARLLTQLGGGGTGEDLFDSILLELKENVEHHVEEEEGPLFEKARPLLSEDEAVSLCKAFEQAKSQLQA